MIPKHVKLVKIPGKGKSVLTKKMIVKGEPALKFVHGITLRTNKRASITAIQIDDDTFLDSEPPDIRDYVNHSCDPNTRVDFELMSYVAIKNIRKGDEITFSYLSTEYDLASKGEQFTCLCGSKNCVGQVKGFRFLTKKEKIKLKPIMSHFILRKLRNNK